ncbi:MAG: PilZ domain-containing protein [Solirubrobacteraceae bacterium]
MAPASLRSSPGSALAPLPPVISPGLHVQLQLPHAIALPATVEAMAGGTVVAVLAVPDRRVHKLAGAEVTVEWITGRGIQRILGRLELDPGRSEVVHVAIHGDLERIQRREWARVPAVVPVRVRGVDEDVGGETSTLNVSGGGVLVKDLWQLPLGLDVRLEVEVEPGKPPIRALGRVVREAARDEKGVRIDSISHDDEERLVRFVRERERAALRMERGR